MTNAMNPTTDAQMNLFIHQNALWGLKCAVKTQTRLIDFEEDEWLHDNHHEFQSTDGSTGNKLVKLFDFADLKIESNEEILIQYVKQVNLN